MAGMLGRVRRASSSPETAARSPVIRASSSMSILIAGIVTSSWGVDEGRSSRMNGGRRRIGDPPPRNGGGFVTALSRSAGTGGPAVRVSIGGIVAGRRSGATIGGIVGERPRRVGGKVAARLRAAGAFSLNSAGPIRPSGGGWVGPRRVPLAARSADEIGESVTGGGADPRRVVGPEDEPCISLTGADIGGAAVSRRFTSSIGGSLIARCGIGGIGGGTVVGFFARGRSIGVTTGYEPLWRAGWTSLVSAGTAGAVARMAGSISDFACGRSLAVCVPF